ncbi:hypothetical protein [Virgibacillus proomii]|uniref:hypothetical protein n=1 Tax=Virgibacillus proomii TaxID=84407 RepID=UPI001C1100B5|nr:hypothetical protein [Virgibacillus proomii]MBU5265619.1 hypothetical protein [Virgibacillus proomii]
MLCRLELQYTERTSIGNATGQGKLRSDASYAEKAFFFFKNKENFGSDTPHAEKVLFLFQGYASAATHRNFLRRYDFNQTRFFLTPF